MLSTELTDILAGCSHESFCFSVCIHIPILAFLSLSLDTSSSMHAIIVSFLLLSSRSRFTWIKNFSSFVENRAAPVDVAMVSLTLMAIRRMSSSPLPFSTSLVLSSSEYSPVGLETEVDATFLKATHNHSYIVVPVRKKLHTLPV